MGAAAGRLTLVGSLEALSDVGLVFVAFLVSSWVEVGTPGLCGGAVLVHACLCSPDDLIVGDIIEIYSRRFHILDCDDETRRWYSDKRACTQPASIKEQVLPKPGTLTNVPF
eukprot:GHVT01080224.1.p3 GENE.GHVT01080224.1~~GHVT01080224.1.p3  ORF type:complete len:112 (-),score=16.24 GHVT01080224.1:1802-2137(-)